MALGSFAIGLTEFAATGLLPAVSADLRVSVPTAGNLVTVYAIGVVIGAPLLTVAGARLPRRTLLLVFMGLFALGNGLAAVAPGFGTLLLARFLSGLPHGAFFGVAALIAAELGGSARRASAVGRLFLGLTVANVVGVPAATVFGQQLGWRVAFALIAGVALLCVAAMALYLPKSTVAAAPDGVRAELGAFRSPAVWLALAMVVLGCGGLFTFSTYIAPMTTEVTGWPPAAVPVQLALLGLGMTAGTILGGRLADRLAPRQAVMLVLAAQSVALLAAGPALHIPVLACLATFGIGTLSLALAPVVQTVVLDVARDAPVLASASLQSAFNIANAVGAALGGLVLSAGWGYSTPPAVGAVLAALGAGVALFARYRTPSPTPAQAAADLRRVGC
jgi:DHA1 family inner membrane transport protein